MTWAGRAPSRGWADTARPPRRSPLESSDAETLLEQGRCLQESGDIEGAFAVYRRLLAQDPAAYAAVVKSVTSASKGMLFLQPSRLRARLFDHG